MGEFHHDHGGRRERPSQRPSKSHQHLQPVHVSSRDCGIAAAVSSEEAAAAAAGGGDNGLSVLTETLSTVPVEMFAFVSAPPSTGHTFCSADMTPPPPPSPMRHAAADAAAAAAVAAAATFANFTHTLPLLGGLHSRISI